MSVILRELCQINVLMPSWSSANDWPIIQRWVWLNMTYYNLLMICSNRFKKSLTVGVSTLPKILSLAMRVLFLLKRFNRVVTVFQHKKETGVVIFSVSYTWHWMTNPSTIQFLIDLGSRMCVSVELQDWVVFTPSAMMQEITPFVNMMKQVGAQQGFNIPQPE